jgi:hypothetical protein
MPTQPALVCILARCLAGHSVNPLPVCRWPRLLDLMFPYTVDGARSALERAGEAQRLRQALRRVQLWRDAVSPLLSRYGFAAL